MELSCGRSERGAIFTRDSRGQAPRRSYRGVMESNDLLEGPLGETHIVDEASPRAKDAAERAILQLRKMGQKLQAAARRQRHAV